MSQPTQIRISCELSVTTEETLEELEQMQPRLASLSNDRRVHVNIARMAIAKMRDDERVRSSNAPENDPVGSFSLATAPLPTLDEIAGMVYNLKICCCTDAIPRSGVLRILSHLLGWQLTIWPCNFIRLAWQLERELGHLPTADDVRNVILLQRAAAAGAAQDVAKTVKPIVIEQWARTGGLTSADTCSLCCNSMTDFTLDEGVKQPRGIRRNYVLPCGHKFHYHEQFCIEGTIRRWFETHSKCPLCRRDYSLETGGGIN